MCLQGMHLRRGIARDVRGSSARFGWTQICAAAGGAGGDADAYGEDARNGVHSGADSRARPGGQQAETEGVEMVSCCCSAQDPRMGDDAAKGGIYRSHKLMGKQMGRGGYKGQAKR
jgi:hypothetical protein